jgi:beta-glucanase (GH16 family)
MNKKRFTGIIMALLVTFNLGQSFSINAKETKDEKQKWVLNWNDEFNGANGTGVSSDKWVYELGNGNGGWGNNELEYYTDSTNNVYQKDGNLVIKALQDKETGQITSGRITTQGKFSTTYGKLEARMKLPVGTGLWPAFWMMPEKDIYGGWAASGELDIMENKGRLPGEVYGTLHYGGSWPNNKYTGGTYSFPQGQSTAEFHTYSVEWEPGEIRWYVDGKLYQTQNNWYTNSSNGEKFSYPAPFDQNFFVILNLAFGGNFDGGKQDLSVIPGEMIVDYVRAYELKDKDYRTAVEPAANIEPLPVGAKTPTADGNLIYNGDFKENNIQENADGSKDFGTGWNFVHAPDFGGNGSAVIDTINGINYAKANITSAGSQNYAVQLIQTTTIGKGRWYKVSFDAKSNTNRTMAMKVSGGADRGYNQYSDQYTLNLTNQFAHFEKYFQMAANTDIKARLEFELGLNTNPVWIGNVRVDELAEAPRLPLQDGNLVSNGGFDKGSMDRMTNWNFSKNNSIASAYVPEASRELAVMINYGGKTPEAVTIDQKEIELQKNASYKLGFKARVKSARTIKAELVSKDGKTTYGTQTFNLTTEMKDFNYEFKMSSDSDTDSQLVFKLGGNNNDVFIDDVSLFKGIDYSQIEVYPLKNGDFTHGLFSWTPYSIEGASASTSVLNGEAKVSISNPGNKPYSVMLNQESFKLSKGVEYTLSFDARATAARNMEAVVDNASYTRYLSKTIAVPAGNEMIHYEYTFKLNIDDTASLKFLIGKTDADVPTTAHDIFIDNVVLEVKNAPVKRPPTLIPDSEDNKVGQPIDITFTDDAAWRESVSAVKINGEALNADKYQLADGKLTLTSDNFSKADTYNIAVEAEGYTNTAVVQSVSENDGNLVTNGKFTDSTNSWKLYTGDGSDAAIQAVDGQMKLNFANYAGWFKWSTQVYQDTIKLEAGKKYVLKFDASSSIAREAWLEMNNMDQKVLALTPESKTFTFEFTAVSTISDGKLNFLLGTNNVSGASFTKNQTVTFDNISITEKTGDVVTPPSTGSIITNGTFDSQKDNWIHFMADWDGAYSTFSVENGEAKVHIAYEGPENWSTQLAQANLALEKGKTYVLSFDARSSLARNIQAIIEQNGGAYTKYMEPKVAALTSDMNHYTFEFTMSSETDSAAHLVFALGKLDGNGSPLVPHDIFIDSVVLAEK